MVFGFDKLVDQSMVGSSIGSDWIELNASHKYFCRKQYCPIDSFKWIHVFNDWLSSPSWLFGTQTQCCNSNSKCRICREIDLPKQSLFATVYLHIISHGCWIFSIWPLHVTDRSRFAIVIPADETRKREKQMKIRWSTERHVLSESYPCEFRMAASGFMTAPNPFQVHFNFANVSLSTAFWLERYLSRVDLHPHCPEPKADQNFRGRKKDKQENEVSPSGQFLGTSVVEFCSIIS